MIRSRDIINGIGIGIVCVGAACVGLVVGAGVQASMAEHTTSEYQQTLARALDDETIRRRARLLGHTRKPDAVIPPITNGLAPVIYRLETQQNVVFLTIDDGNYKDPSVVKSMKQHNLKASLFLSDLFIWHNHEFFDSLIRSRSVVENHTDRHDLKMTHHKAEYQRREICGMSDTIERYYGRRPTLFRAPGGVSNTDTQRIVAECGMRAIVMWTARVERGVVEYQDGRTALRPGDIVLMHFRPDFSQDIATFVAAKNNAGLRVELLEDWIQ